MTLVGFSRRPPTAIVTSRQLLLCRELESLKAKHQQGLPLYLHLADEVSDCRKHFPVLNNGGRMHGERAYSQAVDGDSLARSPR